MTGFTDIAATGWVAHMPPALRPYLLLARLDRPIGIWLLFLPGAWGILLARAPVADSVRLLALFGIGSVVMRAAGCVVNDMWDRDLDRQVRRTAARPLACGALGLRQAAVFLAVLLAAGLAVLLQLPPVCWLLGVGSLVLVALYPLAKRVTWWPQLVMGFTFGFGAPMGMVAATGHITAGAWLIYAAAIAWDLGFDTIYGFQDMEDDAVIGVRSTSRKFAANPRAFIGACYATTVVMLAICGWRVGLGWAFWAVLPVPAVELAWQVFRLEIHNPRRCLHLFRINRETGLTVVLAILAGRT